MNWLETLKQLAPTVASALGGPLAGAAVTALGGIFGLSEPNQDTIARLFKDGQLSADNLAAIRKLELDYQNQERERNFKYSELEFKDKDSARQMQMATHSKMPAILTILVTVGFFGILGLLFFHPELKGNEIVMLMVGQLSAVWAACVSFYVGTTYGSANKNAMLANSQPSK